MQRKDLLAVLPDIVSGKLIPQRTVLDICLSLWEKIYCEPSVLYLTSPIIVCGDVHGQLEDVLQLFKTAGEPDVRKGVQNRYLFLGDYVDRGFYSVNTFLLLACLKLLKPDGFYLLRGNHEFASINTSYGLNKECMQRYKSAAVWILLNDVFKYLPVAAVIDRKYFAVHGGISPNIPLVERISLWPRALIGDQDDPNDLFWSDPKEFNGWKNNTRGAGRSFGPAEIDKFLKENHLQLVIRSHQLAMQGFQWHFKCEMVDEEGKPDETKEGKLLLVWSAPNYCYRERNRASILIIDEQRKRFELKQFDPNPDRLPAEPETAAYFKN